MSAQLRANRFQHDPQIENSYEEKLPIDMSIVEGALILKFIGPVNHVILFKEEARLLGQMILAMAHRLPD